MRVQSLLLRGSGAKQPLNLLIQKILIAKRGHEDHFLLECPVSVTEDRHTATVFTDTVNICCFRTNHEVNVNV